MIDGNNINIEIMFLTFFICIVIDFITGIIAAAKEGKLKSRTCSNGMFRSIGECVVLAMLITGSKLIPELNFILITFIVGFIFKELLSICENLTRLGVWIPASIKKMLSYGINKVENNNDIKS